MWALCHFSIHLPVCLLWSLMPHLAYPAYDWPEAVTSNSLFGTCAFLSSLIVRASQSGQQVSSSRVMRAKASMDPLSYRNTQGKNYSMLTSPEVLRVTGLCSNNRILSNLSTVTYLQRGIYCICDTECVPAWACGQPDSGKVGVWAGLDAESSLVPTWSSKTQNDTTAPLHGTTGKKDNHH